MKISMKGKGEGDENIDEDTDEDIDIREEDTGKRRCSGE